MFVQVHARSKQGPDDAGVPRADDGVPAAALERVAARDARAAVLAAGGGRALLGARAGRRHARADGARVGGARAGRGGGGRRRTARRAGAGRARAARRAPGRARAALPQGEARHPPPGRAPRAAAAATVISSRLLATLTLLLFKYRYIV